MNTNFDYLDKKFDYLDKEWDDNFCDICDNSPCDGAHAVHAVHAVHAIHANHVVNNQSRKDYNSIMNIQIALQTLLENEDEDLLIKIIEEFNKKSKIYNLKYIKK